MQVLQLKKNQAE